MWRELDDWRGDPGTVRRKRVERALGEASASVFSLCVDLAAFGRSHVAGPWNEFEAGTSTRTGSLSDAMLSQLLSGRAKPVGVPEDTWIAAVGDGVFWTIWLDLYGDTWVSGEADPRIAAYGDVCSREVLGSLDGFAAYLEKLASDGVDAPVFDAATAIGSESDPDPASPVTPAASM